MSVRYRPICPQQAWRSQLAHSLTSVERFGEIYLLTNPAANSIGCYPLIPRIAAAEIGMSAEEMQNVICRLEEMSVAILRDGHILVKTWFLHSTWESTLQGNVLKTAKSDIKRMPESLQQHWRDACVSAGVPASVVDTTLAEALASPSKGASKGVEYPTQPKRKTNEEHTTTTTPLVPVVVELDLLSCAESHRDTLLRVAEQHRLTALQRQDLGWELSARLRATEQGQGKPIGVVDRWLTSLAQAMIEGSDILQAGRDLRDQRAKARQTQSIEKLAEQRSARKRAADEAERQQAEAVLMSMDDAGISALIERLSAAGSTRGVAARCEEALRARLVPPSCSSVIKPLMREAGLLPPSKATLLSP